jgi:uncharacterized coiled-coil DUF342 family protein
MTNHADIDALRRKRDAAAAKADELTDQYDQVAARRDSQSARCCGEARERL